MDSAPQGGAGSDAPTGRVMGTSDGHSDRSCVRTSSSHGEDNQSYPIPVESSLAANAAVCGSLGCRETDVLLAVELSGKERVLCSECVVEFVEQEADHA